MGTAKRVVWLTLDKNLAYGSAMRFKGQIVVTLRTPALIFVLEKLNCFVSHTSQTAACKLNLNNQKNEVTPTLQQHKGDRPVDMRERILLKS